MNKKEVTEIKKLFTKERCCLNRLCGCYVDADKNKVVQFKEAFSPFRKKKFTNIWIFSVKVCPEPLERIC